MAQKKRQTGGNLAIYVVLLTAVAREKTWQLALVIILPLVIGYWLDNFFQTFPGLFIAGIILALTLVTWLMANVDAGDVEG